MKKFVVSFSSALLLAASFVAPATAQLVGTQASKTVEAKLAVFQVSKSADGKVVLIPADKAKPGDTLEYQVAYQNNSASAVKSLTATLPLPAGLVYVPGSAEPTAAQASVDGEVFADMPLKKKVKNADGKLVEKLVPYADYRALRWALGELRAREKLTVSARALVGPVAAGSASGSASATTPSK